jgi:hypothetical protein
VSLRRSTAVTARGANAPRRALPSTLFFVF